MTSGDQYRAEMAKILLLEAIARAIIYGGHEAEEALRSALRYESAFRDQR